MKVVPERGLPTIRIGLDIFFLSLIGKNNQSIFIKIKLSNLTVSRYKPTKIVATHIPNVVPTVWYALQILFKIPTFNLSPIMK